MQSEFARLCEFAETYAHRSKVISSDVGGYTKHTFTVLFLTLVSKAHTLSVAVAVSRGSCILRQPDIVNSVFLQTETIRFVRSIDQMFNVATNTKNHLVMQTSRSVPRSLAYYFANFSKSVVVSSCVNGLMVSGYQCNFSYAPFLKCALNFKATALLDLRYFCQCWRFIGSCSCMYMTLISIQLDEVRPALTTTYCS